MAETKLKRFLNDNGIVIRRLFNVIRKQRKSPVCERTISHVVHSSNNTTVVTAFQILQAVRNYTGNNDLTLHDIFCDPENFITLSENEILEIKTNSYDQ